MKRIYTVGSEGRERDTLALQSGSASRFMNNAIELIERFCGVCIMTIKANENVPYVDLYHGNDLAQLCGMRIPMVESYSATTVPLVPDLTEESGPVSVRDPFPFDIFSALRFWLADEAHIGVDQDCLDDHDRLRPCCSLQDKLGVKEIPVVNGYLMFFLRRVAMLLGHMPDSFLPAGKRCGVVLSHDVDDPINPDWRGLIWKARITAKYGKFRESLRFLKSAGKQAGHAWGKRTPHERHWLFEEVMDAEECRGFHSTFFFSVRPCWAPGASAYDVAYDIHDPQFRKVLRRIQLRGWDIGLHLSYKSTEGDAQILSERRSLEEAAGTPIIGNRHHYWHMKWPSWKTLQSHASAGLRYDSSVAFNETPGFRLGIALPFFPWNPLTGERIATLQIPCMCMDGSLFYQIDQTVDGAVSRIATLVDQLKCCRGVAAIDWHVRTSFPGSQEFRRWGEAYLAILDLLFSDKEVLVLSAKEAYEQFCRPVEH